MGTLTLGAGQRPRLFVSFDLHIFKGDRLHHLTDGAVRQDHGGHAVLVCQVETLDGQACHLLHGGRRQNDHPVVAVTAAFGSLEVVGLRGLDAAQTGAAALDVDYEGRHVRTGDIAQTFGLQRDSGTGGGGHNTHAGSGSAVDHVDGCDFTFRLEEHTADLGHLLCHVGGDLRLRGDGVAEVVAAAGANGGLRNGLVTLHKYTLCHGLPPYFSTVMIQSGHMVAQNAQPMHLSW